MNHQDTKTPRNTPSTDPFVSPCLGGASFSNTNLTASILGISVWAPGLPGWEAARPTLAGQTPWTDTIHAPPPPMMLPPTERRRAGPVIRLALAVAAEATARSGLDPASLRCVFGSSNGDGPVVGGILQALATASPGERVVSPTQFHNSVHNAPAGYWSIGHASRQPATCLGAHDATWPASLLKAMAELQAEQEPVLLCCYDHPLPPPLDALRPTGAAFAIALILAPSQPGSPHLNMTWHPGPAPQSPLPPPMAHLRTANRIAESLPLLIALAANTPTTHAIPYLDGHLMLTMHTSS